MSFWEADALLREYLSVSNPFAFGSCWHVSDSRVNKRSIRRPAALSRGVRGSANRFTQCAIRLADDEGSTLCRLRLSGPQLNLLSVQYERDAGIWAEAVLLAPRCFKWLASISLVTSFPDNPLRDWHVVCMAGRHGMAVYGIGKGIIPERFSKNGLAVSEASGLWMTELMDVECRDAVIWLDAAIDVQSEAKVAVLQAPRSRVVVYALEEDKEELTLVKTYDLVSLQAQKRDWRAPDDLAPIHASLTQGKLQAEVDIIADELQALVCSGNGNEVYLAGRKIWRLDLKTKALSCLYPPAQECYRTSVYRYNEEQDITDFGFTALSLHPEHSDILAAVSGVSHMILILSLGHNPPRVLAAVPLPDIYKSSSYHFDALWLNGSLAGTTQRSGDFLIVAPSTTFQDGLRTVTPVVWFDKSLFESEIHWNAHEQENFRNPFAFCLQEFSMQATTRHLCTGLLRGPGDCALTAARQRDITIGYHLWLVETTPQNVAQCAQDYVKAKLMWPAPARSGGTALHSANIRAFVEGELAKIGVEETQPEDTRAFVCPRLLDAVVITKDFESWDPQTKPHKHPHFLALPKPTCGCGLGDKYAVGFDRRDANEPDVVGPMDGVQVYQPNEEQTAVEGLAQPHSFAAHGDSCIGATADPIISQTCASLKGVCARSAKWKEYSAPPRKATSHAPRQRRTFDPMGLPINESLIKALKSAWRVPPLDETESDVQEQGYMPVWLNLQGPATRKAAEEAARAATFRQLMSSQIGSSQLSSQYDELAEGGGGAGVDMYEGDDD